MSEHLFEYDLWVEKALLGVVRTALRQVSIHGLREDHHFYITFKTAYPDVEVPSYLREKYPDEIYCMWFNDAWESQKFCTFPIVSKKWVKELGYFMFPFFKHFFIDTWVWMLAKSVDRAIYIPDILVEHRHWKAGKAEKDETYNRNITTATNSRHARDREIMDNFERYFVADVGLLEGLITNKEN